MSVVEQLAQEQFNTFKNRLCEILCEIEEEHKSAFMQGYAKGETDEKFRTKQVVTSHIVNLEKENEMLKRHCMKFNSNTMIEFGAYVLYYSANPESKMDIPNCVYERVEKMFEKWKEEK